jgi:ABC-type Fe3+-siderophore transport system permease subunit
MLIVIGILVLCIVAFLAFLWYAVVFTLAIIGISALAAFWIVFAIASSYTDQNTAAVAGAAAVGLCFAGFLYISSRDKGTNSRK